jgi:hypothetical protein
VQVRRLALKCALSAKANEGRLLLLDSLQPWAPKTRVLASALQPLLDTQAAAAAAASVAAAATAARRGGAQGATRSELGLPQLLLAFERRRAARVATLRRRSGIDAPRYRSMLQAGRLRLRQQTRELEARRRRQGQGRDEAPTLRLPVPLSAVLLDSGKEGLDGGEALRRAAANLPGACACCCGRCGEHTACALTPTSTHAHAHRHRCHAHARHTHTPPPQASTCCLRAAPTCSACCGAITSS